VLAYYAGNRQARRAGCYSSGEGSESMISRSELAAAAASFLFVAQPDTARAQTAPKAASPAAVKPLPLVSGPLV